MLRCAGPVQYRSNPRNICQIMQVIRIPAGNIKATIEGRRPHALLRVWTLFAGAGPYCPYCRGATTEGALRFHPLNRSQPYIIYIIYTIIYILYVSDVSRYDICVRAGSVPVQVKPRKYVLDHAVHTAPSRQDQKATIIGERHSHVLLRVWTLFAVAGFML